MIGITTRTYMGDSLSLPPVRLSHTGITMYEECGFKYYLRYIEKFVSKNKGSALVFGTAIDAGLNYLILNKDDLKGAMFRFDRKWSKQPDHTYKNVKIKGGKFVTYTKSNHSPELLTEADERRLKDCPAVELATWYSMRRKGHILIKAYHDHLLPQIGKVISAQKMLTLTNAEGDVIVGVVDLIAELLDGRTALLDNKTSSIKYKDDSVRESIQLAMYKWIMEETESVNIEALGYMVVNKKLLKGGVAKTQLIVDEVNDEIIEKTINRINAIVVKIKNKEFPQNKRSCRTFYGDCDYKKYCFNNKCMDDLIDMKKEKK